MTETAPKSAPSPFGKLIDDLKARDLHRECRAISGPQGPKVIINGRSAILLCSNNYLGLADHPELAEAASRAALDLGVGAGASRLVSGAMDIHRQLEERLAVFKKTEKCMLFNSGYHANIGVLSSIAGKGDVIYSDELNHASVIDGARLAKASVRVYPHLDVEALDEMISRDEVEGRRVIVTDAVFSMDGDIAPLDKMVDLKRRYEALLVVDEAHATGVVGPGGRGLAADMGLEDSVDVVVGTLGKAFGGFGAFAAGSGEIIDWIINTARSFIFTTALPPAVVASSLAALDIIEREPERVEALKGAARYMRRGLTRCGLDVDEGYIPIIPLMVGDARKALTFAEKLLEDGVFCQAIRPPSVPDGTSRLRVTVMATHTREHLDRAIEAIGNVAAELGLIPK